MVLKDTEHFLFKLSFKAPKDLIGSSVPQRSTIIQKTPEISKFHGNCLKINPMKSINK